MTKLFELYVHDALRQESGAKIQYQKIIGKGGPNQLDYLLKDGANTTVIDAKYKTKWKEKTNHNDVRQVSGYSRLKVLYNIPGLESEKLIRCTIIYPDQTLTEEGILTEEIAVDEYVKVWKRSIRLPQIKN
jgi:5-methylcytosine-specific restriction enzyme subunit McrC